jgi:transcriptional regulator with PAS, ATPase and Fis domain
MNLQNIQSIKQRFGIIGNSPILNRAIEVASQVANTDLSVLVTGESGTGKEIMPQIIHNLSPRKHGQYIAVNCGAIPEGTIDSELFGHEKGSFTGAHEARKGYFEVANGGTIFLDEVAELPLQTQVRLLRILETGEYMKVGSSKVMKTDVRIIAATNVNIPEAIRRGKFREDLYYRLNTVPIYIPALRDRKHDVYLLFRKFASDFAEKYRMPPVKLDEEAIHLLENYSWPGNIRQLKNTAEQISVIESERDIHPEQLIQYLPKETAGVPAVISSSGSADLGEKELLFKVIFDLRNELNDLKKVVFDLVQGHAVDLPVSTEKNPVLTQFIGNEEEGNTLPENQISRPHTPALHHPHFPEDIDDHVEVEESLSLEEREKELIRKALQKHRNKRKHAARELGISERTLYRKIKEYKL